VRGVCAVHGPLAGEYFDAHLDVRETTGSGMPFRRLVEECNAGPLRVHGLNPIVNSKEHTDWFLRHRGEICTRWAPPDRPAHARMFVSMDLDVLDAAHAPGVSAINPAGWSVRELEAAALWAGRDPRVVCFDLMELCPTHDVGGRTARVACHLFLTFLRGLSERPA
ncbi:MAG: arginase family protein, partial [Phycisphaerales bacterium]